MPTVLRMRLLLVCKLSFRLLWLNRCTVRRRQMPHNACKGHWEFRYRINFIRQPAQIHIHVQMRLAGTSLCQRCLLSDEIPSAPSRLYNVLVADRPCHYSTKQKKLFTPSFSCLKKLNNKKETSFRLTEFSLLIQS